MKVLHLEFDDCNKCPHIDWQCADNKPSACRDGYYCNHPDAPANCFIISDGDLILQKKKTGSSQINIPDWCRLPDLES